MVIYFCSCERGSFSKEKAVNKTVGNKRGEQRQVTPAEGVIKRFVKHANYGFIETGACPQDVYFHGSELQQSRISKVNRGQSVRFDLYYDGKGRARATNLKLQGAEVKVLQAANNWHNATIKWFNESKNFGFVSLDMGSDAFLHRSVLDGANLPSYHCGEGVRMQVKIGPGKKPGDVEVTDIKLLS